MEEHSELSMEPLSANIPVAALKGLPPHPECSPAMEKADVAAKKLECNEALCESSFASPPSEWYTNGTSSEEFIGCRCVPSPSPPPAPPATPSCEESDDPCKITFGEPSAISQNPEEACKVPDVRETCPVTCGVCVLPAPPSAPPPPCVDQGDCTKALCNVPWMPGYSETCPMTCDKCTPS